MWYLQTEWDDITAVPHSLWVSGKVMIGLVRVSEVRGGVRS